MDFPKELSFLSTENLQLPSGEHVCVSKADVCFEQWKGDDISDTYGGKQVVDIKGEPFFAELAILRFFQNAGWQGVWVDTFRRKYRTQFTDSVELPAKMLTVLNGIFLKVGSSNGCWDVFCWKGEDIVFAESKRFSKDRIRSTQLIWLEAALKFGFNLNSFLIVQWRIK